VREGGGRVWVVWLAVLLILFVQQWTGRAVRRVEGEEGGDEEGEEEERDGERREWLCGLRESPVLLYDLCRSNQASKRWK
jgi:hypothetical protein